METGRKRLFFGILVATILTSLGVSQIAAAAPASSLCPYAWNRNLKIGNVGEDILKLQQFLNSNPSTVVSAAGLGSSGSETTKYGTMTFLAVKKFQELYKSEILTPGGLTAGTGIVGPATRAKLNSLCALQTSDSLQSQNVNSQKNSSPTLVISAADQPASSLAPANAQFIPFTKITLTAQGGDVTVNKMNIRQIGLANDQAFYSLSLLDENGTDLSDAYMHSDHTTSFNDSFVIPAGTSKTLSVTGSMNADLTNYDGQKAQFEIESIAADSPLVGSFPVIGTAHTINSSLVIGSAMTVLSPNDPNGSQTRYVNDKNVRIAGIRVTAGSEEDLRLDGILWDQAGSAGSDDIKNVVTVVDGVSYPATLDGHSYTSVISPGIVIKKGTTVDIIALADIGTNGVGRTVEFDLRYSTDIFLTGLTYGFGVAPLPAGNTAQSGHSVFITDTGDTSGVSGVPYFVGSVTRISAGVLQSIGR